MCKVLLKYCENKLKVSWMPDDENSLNISGLSALFHHYVNWFLRFNSSACLCISAVYVRVCLQFSNSLQILFLFDGCPTSKCAILIKMNKFFTLHILPTIYMYRVGKIQLAMYAHTQKN